MADHILSMGKNLCSVICLVSVSMDMKKLFLTLLNLLNSAYILSYYIVGELLFLQT